MIPRAIVRAPWWRRVAAWLRSRLIESRKWRACDPLFDSREDLELEVERARVRLQHAEWALSLKRRLVEADRLALIELRRAIARRRAS